ncbi:MAG: hypothetical protein H7829_13400 [Magnetococcus sp. THC-1_WYH]
MKLAHPTCFGKNKLLKEKRGLGDCPQGFDFKSKASFFSFDFVFDFKFRSLKIETFLFNIEKRVKSGTWKPFCLKSKTKPWGQSPRPLFSFNNFIEYQHALREKKGPGS